jgi:hypothetical protein
VVRGVAGELIVGEVQRLPVFQPAHSGTRERLEQCQLAYEILNKLRHVPWATLQWLAANVLMLLSANVTRPDLSM